MNPRNFIFSLINLKESEKDLLNTKLKILDLELEYLWKCFEDEKNNSDDAKEKMEYFLFHLWIKYFPNDDTNNI